MEQGRPLFVAVVAALAVAAPAGAALEVRISVTPAKPRAGQRTVVQVRPYWTYLRPDGSCCRLEPADVTYPFRLEAVSPGGRVFRPRLRRGTNPFVWTTSFTFRARGTWTLREPHWGPGYSTSAGGRPRIRVSVGR
ncbi:MAG TPA: hypothetical protein VFL41_02830 [Gaiellaceae bacterium]|nr:hypothetical protein [Gaiellaceae bacterium]